MGISLDDFLKYSENNGGFYNDFGNSLKICVMTRWF